MGLSKIIGDTLERFQGTRLAKAGFTTSSGLVFYDLEPQAKLLYPVLAPLRKRIARVGSREAGQGLAAHWNVVTNPNPGNVSAVVAEGQRGGSIQPSTAPKIATYKGIGLENPVTWEAEYAGEGYEDIRGLAQRTALDSLILQEEPLLLWGNSGTAGVGLQFGTTPTPAGTPSTTGGTLAAGTTTYLYCVALSYDGFIYSTATTPNAVQQTITRTNADNTTLTYNAGSAAVSVASSAITTTGTTSSIVGTVTAVKGAVAYAWFIGATAGAGNAYFSQITTVNVATITSQPTTGQKISDLTGGTDYSFNPYEFDGLIPQLLSSNGYFASLDGGTLTGDSANGIVQIETMLKYFWDTYRISPTRFYVGSQVVRDLTKKIVASGNPGYRINITNTPDGTSHLTGSALVGDYTNKFAFGGAKPIPIELHPNMPDGQLFADLEINPYPTANIAQARAVRTRRDYFMVVWPIKTRQYENGIYADECLQVYVPYGMGLISNIGPG